MVLTMMFEGVIGRTVFRQTSTVLIKLPVINCALFLCALNIHGWLSPCSAPAAAGQRFDDVTTAMPNLDELRQRAQLQCSYRYSSYIYNVTETQCRDCASQWNGTQLQLSEEPDKIVYRITFDCRPMRDLKEYLRKLCRSPSSERRTLQSYVDCDECLYRNGVKEVGTSFDEVVNARKLCIRVGHKVSVLTSSFGGRIYRDYKYNYDYELLRETYRQSCIDHLSEESVLRCDLCFENMFLWPDYPLKQAQNKLQSCLPTLTRKENIARSCQFLNNPAYKHLFAEVSFNDCRTCFQNAAIEENASREEQLAASYRCLPPAKPREELQLQLCAKIDGDLPLWNVPEEQPRNLCFEWASQQNISAGISYAQYKAAHQDTSNKVMEYLSNSCIGASEAMERCRACIELAFSRVILSPVRVFRDDIGAALRCLFINRDQQEATSKLGERLSTIAPLAAYPPAPGDLSPGPDLVLTNNNRRIDDPPGPAIRIVSDSS